jgi:hypothetical protein
MLWTGTNLPLLLLLLLLLLLIAIIQSIYNYITEANHVPTVHSVAAVL